MSRLITEPNSCIRSVISPCREPQASCGRRWGGAGGKTEDKSLLPHFCFKKSLRFLQLWAQKHRIWGWEETLASMSFFFFFQEETFFLFLFLWLKRLHQPPPPPQLSTQFPAHRLSSLHLSGAFGTPEIFFSSFSVSQWACTKNKFLSHRLKFARTFARVEMKLFFLLDKRWTD